MLNFDFKKIIKIVAVIVGIFIISLVSIHLYFSYILKGKVSVLPFSPSQKTATPTPKITLPKILYNLTGSILKLENNTVFFDAGIPQIDENGQPVQKREQRTALITPTTKFSSLTFVNQEGSDKKTPLETPLTFKDLRVGDFIEVISNRDISQTAEFEITQLRVLLKSIK